MWLPRLITLLALVIGVSPAGMAQQGTFPAVPPPLVSPEELALASPLVSGPGLIAPTSQSEVPYERGSPPSPARVAGVFGGSALGGALGGLLGGAAGYGAALATGCGGWNCLFLPLAGSAVGVTVMAPVGAHLANEREGSLQISMLISAAIAAAGIGTVFLTGVGDETMMLAIPLAQVAASTITEMVTGHSQ
jgi:hypothetical protein